MRHGRPAGAVRFLTDAQMFLSSYAFLFVLFGLRVENAAVRWTSFCLALLGVVIVALFLSGARANAGATFTLARVENRGADVASYLVTYLLPFIVIDAKSWGDYAAYVIFIVVVGAVYINSDMIYVNPLLYVFGRKVVSIEAGDGTRGMCIVRTIPSPGTDVQLVRIRDFLYVQT